MLIDLESEKDIRRRFVVVGHRTRTDGRFKLDDLCGSTGRLDILLRSINSAFVLSHSIRKDTDIVMIMKNEGWDEDLGQRAVLFHGPKLKYLNPDERSTGALVRNALLRYNKAPTDGWLKASPGIYISAYNLCEVLNAIKAEAIIYLNEGGLSAREWLKSNHYKYKVLNFVLSDNIDLHEEEDRMVKSLADAVLNVGPLSLHTDHCIIIIHNILDILGF